MKRACVSETLVCRRVYTAPNPRTTWSSKRVFWKVGNVQSTIAAVFRGRKHPNGPGLQSSRVRNDVRNGRFKPPSTQTWTPPRSVVAGKGKNQIRNLLKNTTRHAEFTIVSLWKIQNGRDLSHEQEASAKVRASRGATEERTHAWRSTFKYRPAVAGCVW
jgi:hypothetical protein